MESAMALLGYAYTIEGKVVHGNAKGTGIGFPTANIMADSEFIIPARGVYVGSVMIDEISYPAMINIGYNPTFNKRRLLSMEAHLLDFHQNIYDKEVSVAFYKKIRSEKRFNSIDELIEQLNKDVEVTREYFR
jgi:riboflavin kinase/FMN adenylyltransferase